MSCTRPLLATRRQDGSIQFIKFKIASYRSALDIGYFFLPCSQCSGCRLDQARQKAIRSQHEASLYRDNCFLTLTYSNENLKSPSLFHKDFQLFAKKLRKYFTGHDLVYHKEKLIAPIRIMMCGEYGEKLSRPHFHACVYNFNFDDRKHFFTSKGYKVYRSSILEKLWPHGISSIGSLTFDSASYVARYCMKKVTGKAAAEHYGDLTPEYAQLPRGFGLGYKWLEKYYKDVYPADRLVVLHGDSSYECRPPRYYDQKISEWYPDLWQEVQSKRLEQLSSYTENFKDGDLAVKEKIQYKRIKELTRQLEAI